MLQWKPVGKSMQMHLGSNMSAYVVEKSTSVAIVSYQRDNPGDSFQQSSLSYFVRDNSMPLMIIAVRNNDKNRKKLSETEFQIHKLYSKFANATNKKIVHNSIWGQGT